MRVARQQADSCLLFWGVLAVAMVAIAAELVSHPFRA